MAMLLVLYGAGSQPLSNGSARSCQIKKADEQSKAATRPLHATLQIGYTKYTPKDPSIIMMPAVNSAHALFTQV